MRTFLVVAEELHFGRTAKRLNLAQPAVSQHIQNLEKALKVRLFVRDRRSVRLSDAGKAFIQPCKDALSAVEFAAISASNAGSGDVGTLRLGYNSGFASDEAVEFVRLVSRNFPGISFQMDTGSTNDELIDLVEERKLDLAILGGPPVGKPAIGWHRFCDFTLGVLMRKDHALADRESLSLAELADETLIMVRHTSGKTLQHLVVSLYEKDDVALPPIIDIGDAMSLFTLCTAGLGVGFGGFPSATLTPVELCTIPLRNNTNYDIGLAWKIDAITPPLANVLQLTEANWPTAGGT